MVGRIAVDYVVGSQRGLIDIRAWKSARAILFIYIKGLWIVAMLFVLPLNSA